MIYKEIFISSTGTKICLSLWESKKDDPVVIFLPGTLSHPLSFKGFLENLSLEGFNVLGVHFISHGKSPRERKLFTFADLKQNVKDAITYAIDNYNENILVLGSSQGGILASVVASEDKRVRAVFSHCLAMPQLPESIEATRFPRFFKYFVKPLLRLLDLISKIFPGMSIYQSFYSNVGKITQSKEWFKEVKRDPFYRRSYPLCFVSSLFNEDMSGLTDGSLKCPLIAIMAERDPIFSFEYVKSVFNKVMAPKKEFLAFDLKNHLLFNECLAEISTPVFQKLREYSGR